jgi:hypothetical protein
MLCSPAWAGKNQKLRRAVADQAYSTFVVFFAGHATLISWIALLTDQFGATKMFQLTRPQGTRHPQE